MKYKNNQQIFTYREHEVEPGIIVPLLHFKQLEEVAGITHCFTTRAGGVSIGDCASMNLSFTRGDDESAVLENYRRVALAMGTEIGQFVCTDQTHTTNVRKVTKEDAGKGVVRPKGYTDVDGLITNEPGLVLSTFYADCVPLYFVDPVHKAIGLSHSGWRGTVNKMGQVTIQAMQREYGSRPEDLYCAIGPSICQDCYEVSRDVAEEFMKAFPGHEEEILWQKSEEKFQLNLWKANEIVLLEAGVLPEHLAVTNLCTCCNHEELFSHRASKGKRGNLAAFLSIMTEACDGNNKNYIQWIRSKVGHEKIMLVFAGGCVFNEKGEVLLQKRGDCNKWGFPGGAIELGETPEMAAIREVKEETGLDVEVEKLIGIYTDSDFVYPNGDKAQSICIGYELKIVGGELVCDNEETLELKFFSLNDMPPLFCKQHEELLEDIIKRR